MKKRVEKNSEIIKEIETEKIKTKNKKIVKILLWTFIPLIFFSLATFLTLHFIGNLGIVVKEYPIKDNKINEDLDGLKIIHFSCIHYNQFTSNKKISQLVKMINNTNPDIIIFTGDLVDKKYVLKKEEREFLIKELNLLKTTIGKYAILGEDSLNVKEIYDSSNFKLLSDSNEEILINKSIINLTAYYDARIIEVNEEANYSISLVHMPDKVDEILNSSKPNLILSGHSHNGQIRFPLIGPIRKKEGSKKYVDSFYNINDSKLFISGGLGNNGIPLRLFNHPSINFYRLKSIK